MGKKTKKRPRWRKLSLDDGEERRSPSPGHSEGGGGVASQRDKYRPRSRTSFSRSHSVTTYVFDEDEYTKIQTPRQDMIFKKSAFTRRRAPADGSLSEEAETQSVGTGSEPAPPSDRPSCPPAEQASSTTPELSEVSSDGKPASECGEGSEPRDPLAALASQIQYAFIDPQGNVYFNVMDESGIIHLPPVAGYYMAPSYPGGPVVATPVPWQAVPIAPLDSPEYQALMRRQQQQQQQPQQPQQPLQEQQQLQQQEEQPQQQQQQMQPAEQGRQLDQQQAQQAADGQQDGQQDQQQQQQELANGETSSLAGSRSRSELSDDATSATGSRPTSPALPSRLNGSWPEHDYAEQEQETAPGDEGKTRRLKKKKKKQKKKTNSVDSGVTDDGSDGCREPPPTPDCVAICSDSSASGGRVRAEHKSSSDRPASDQTSSGVQSDVSLPDSPQRRPSGDRGHVTGAVLVDSGSRDGQLLHSAATVLSRQLDTQLKMQPTAATPEMTAQPPAKVVAQATTPVAALPLPSQFESQPKNESAAVSALEAAILPQVQRTTDADPACGHPPQPTAAQCVPAVSGGDAIDAPIAADDASEGDAPEHELVDDDAESCDSFVYEDKSLGELVASSPSPGDFLDTDAALPAGESADGASRKSSSASQVSEVLTEFEDDPVAPCSFTDLSQPVDLRRTVILEETESERDRESTPGSIGSREKESSEERQVRSSEERLEEHSGKLQEEATVREPVVVEETVSAKAAIEVCTLPDVYLPSKEGGSIEGSLDLPSTGAPFTALPMVAPPTEARLPKDTVEPCPVLPSDVVADLHKEAPKALPSASNVANVESTAGVGALPASAPAISLQPHLASPAPDTSPPPDGAPSPPSPSSPPSSLSDRSISSAVRGWLKDQAPEAVFVVADDSDADDDSDLDGDDADWESDAETAAPATTSSAPPKNAQGNPSPVRRSSAGAGERVANRSKVPAARLNTAAYYSLGVALDEPASPPVVLQLVDLDERAVLTVPLDGARQAGVAAAAAGDSDGSEEVDTGPLGAPPAPAEPPHASLAQELLQVGSLHRASDRQLIGDSAVFSAAAGADCTSAAAPTTTSKTVVCQEAGAGPDEADEGYGGSPLASPEARPRPRGLPPHPLHHIGAQPPTPWGVCCSLQ